MLKDAKRVENTSKELELQAMQQLRGLLSSLPLRIEKKEREKEAADQGVDFLLQLDVEGRRWTLACEVKSSGQPRNIRLAAWQAKEYAQHAKAGVNIYPVVLAPFISPATGEICKEMGVGYADLAGNCRIAFGNVYIEKSVAKNPFRVRREQRSLFAPKSARVLRVLFAEPQRSWKIAALAQKASVSLGQTSNVRRMLLDREWISAQRGELRLSRPDALLDAWRAAYVAPYADRVRYYTVLHGVELEKALHKAFTSMRATSALTGGGPLALLSSFSAARWLAPFARVAGEFLYADPEGEELLKPALKLEPVSRGENVIIDRPKDNGVFLASLEPKPGLHCTGLIQTFLDLAASGERGAEAADHLRRLKIDPLWKGLA